MYTPLAFGFYAEEFSQNSSQLVDQVIRIRTQLNRSLSGCHVNWLSSKRELRQGLVTKVVVFWLALCVVLHCIALW
jgi:hypothetical protein